MTMRRPPHLQRRSAQGRAFGEPITIRRSSGTRDPKTGRYSESFTDIETRGSTAPATTDNALVRNLAQSGIMVTGMRLFWTVERLAPAEDTRSSGDVVKWQDQEYRIKATAEWDSFSESVGIRIEGQDLPQ